MRDRTLLAASVALTVMGLCILTGCGSSDTTTANLPVVHWSVRDVATGKTENFTGNARASIPEGHAVNIVLTATSPDKVQRLTAKGKGQWTCHGNGGARSYGVREKPSQIEHTIRQGKTSEVLYYGSDFSGWKCGSGFGKPTGHFVFTGEGESFAFDIGTAKLTICNSRGC